MLPPFGPKEWRGLREDFETLNIDERTRRREIRQKKEIDPIYIAYYNKPWWLRSYSLPEPHRATLMKIIISISSNSAIIIKANNIQLLYNSYDYDYHFSHDHPIFFMTFAVDWALKANYLSIYLLMMKALR